MSDNGFTVHGDEYLLVTELTKVLVPLVNEEFCEVWFSYCRLDDWGVTFMVGVDAAWGSANGKSDLVVARFPWGLLAGRNLVEQAVQDVMAVSVQSGDRKVIIAPDVAEVKTCVGVSFFVLFCWYSVEGEWVAFSLVIKQSGCMRLREIPMLCFPLNLTRPEDAFWFS